MSFLDRQVLAMEFFFFLFFCLLVNFLFLTLVFGEYSATFLDWLDGRIARWRNKSSLLGQELDSLADLISFGVAPVVLAFATGLHSPADMFVLSFFVCCGISRLARYNATVANLPRDAAGR
ncbi:MAG: hypothetical protein BJ554DRAFT_4058, partial [Olpidium bornovanus]